MPRQAQLTELLMMGLRLAEGVAIARVESTSGRPLRDSIDANGLDRLIDGGLLRLADGQIVATQAGRQRLDAVLRRLL